MLDTVISELCQLKIVSVMSQQRVILSTADISHNQCFGVTLSDVVTRWVLIIRPTLALCARRDANNEEYQIFLCRQIFSWVSIICGCDRWDGDITVDSCLVTIKIDEDCQQLTTNVRFSLRVSSPPSADQTLLFGRIIHRNTDDRSCSMISVVRMDRSGAGAW